MTPRETRSRTNFSVRRQFVEQLLQLDQAYHMSELENNIGVVEGLREINDALFLVLYSKCLRHLL